MFPRKLYQMMYESELSGDVYIGFSAIKFRSFLFSTIHKAIVTEANLGHVRSITVDAELLELAGLLPNERILVVSNSTGARLETYTLEGVRHSGSFAINGAASHLIGN